MTVFPLTIFFVLAQCLIFCTYGYVLVKVYCAAKDAHLPVPLLWRNLMIFNAAFMFVGILCMLLFPL